MIARENQQRQEVESQLTEVQRDAAALLSRIDALEFDLRNIPLRVGIPGCTVTVPNGARVRVLFESASPKGSRA